MTTTDNRSSRARRFKRFACGLCLTAVLGATGCQIEVGGQVLPSPNYLSDDIQYFAPGPEFPLAREAAAQKLRKAEAEELETGQAAKPGP